MALLGKAQPPSLEVAVIQVQDLMDSIVVSNQQLQGAREQERELEQRRMSDHQNSIQLHGSLNTSLENQLLSLQSQIKTNASTLATETKAEADVEKVEQDSLDHKKERVQQLSKKLESLGHQMKEIERRIALQELANLKGHTPEIDRKIVGATGDALGW